MSSLVDSTLPPVGSLAQDFTLPSTGDMPVTLSSLRGKQTVLLAFFPMAFTSTCTAEVCEFSEDYGAYAERGAIVLPISVDSVPALRAFKAETGVAIDMLSDSRRYVSRLYGTLNERAYYSRRSYLLIDRDGVVRWTWLETKSGQKRDTATLLAQLDALA